MSLPDLKPYYRVIVTKTAWYWHENRQIDQQYRIEDTETNPHKCSYLIIDKGTKKFTVEKIAYLTYAVKIGNLYVTK